MMIVTDNDGDGGSDNYNDRGSGITKMMKVMSVLAINSSEWQWWWLAVMIVMTKVVDN